MTDDCPFCHLEQGRLIQALPNALVIWDGFPVSPGHALVVPRRHVAVWADLTREERIDIMDGIDIARAAIETKRSPDAYNIGINDGIAAGQTVMHVHMHVIPRYQGDHPNPVGGIRWVVPAEARHWKDVDTD
jgi:diadenosine tetraphosphate (Ap4A) HIT family hydrolase